MTIKQLQKLCHKQAIDKGFWNGEGFLSQELVPRNNGELLMLIVSELGEALEALRQNCRQEAGQKWRKDTFEDEVADSVIRILDMAEALDINLEWQISKKLAYNETRPHKHGKEF